MFSDLHFHFFLFVVAVALLAQCVGDGYSTAVADVAVSHQCSFSLLKEALVLIR